MARPLSALGTPSSRLGIGVAALALVVYAGALANGFAWDDAPIVADNTLVHHASGLWRAFAMPYWPPAMGGYLYRPLVVVSYALDWLVAPGHAWWFHGVNVVWHAGASVAVALLARRWAGDAAGWIAGALFAVHPVHAEAVANVIGRAELMAAAFSMLAVWLAVERDRLAASAVAWALALLAKENAAVAPALVGAAWLLGFRRPPARRMAMYAAAGCVVGVGYILAREVVFGPYPMGSGMAVVFLDQSPLTMRLTAVAALADVARLLVFPLTLRADYSPNERTAVTAFGDPRFLAGLACVALWAALLWLSWRRHRRVETLGIAWIGIALAPVTNLLFPVGVLVAERTLYLPSVSHSPRARGSGPGGQGRAREPGGSRGPPSSRRSWPAGCAPRSACRSGRAPKPCTQAWCGTRRARTSERWSAPYMRSARAVMRTRWRASAAQRAYCPRTTG